MDQQPSHTPISARNEQPSSLLHLLSNSLILYHAVPYLPISSLLALGATSKSFKALIHETPRVFRYLELSNVNSARSEIGSVDNGGKVWRNVQMDEYLTEDDFYGGPLRGIFNNLRRRNLLLDVQTLILDGLSVPSDLVSEIILDDSYNVRILSIREVQHLNEAKLMQALKYSCRASRAPKTPRLQGLYIFGRKEAPKMVKPQRRFNRYPAGIAPIDTIPNCGVMSSHGARLGANASEDGLLREGEVWRLNRGNGFPRPISEEWAYTMIACEGIISFDAGLCNGPRHAAGQTLESRNADSPWYNLPENHISPRAATHTLDGCSKCGDCPEGTLEYSQAPLSKLPLLAPPPLHTSTSKAAKTPFENNVTPSSKTISRCMDCLQQRYCENCRKWWCEQCLHNGMSQTMPTTSSEEEFMKVHMGLCVENCLVAEMMSGAGSNGMWG